MPVEMRLGAEPHIASFIYALMRTLVVASMMTSFEPCQSQLGRRGKGKQMGRGGQAGKAGGKRTTATYLSLWTWSKARPHVSHTKEPGEWPAWGLGPGVR